MLDHILSGKLGGGEEKKSSLKLWLSAKDFSKPETSIKHYWNITTVEHNKRAHSSTAWMGWDLGSRAWEGDLANLGNMPEQKYLCIEVPHKPCHLLFALFCNNEIVSSSTPLISTSIFFLCLCLKLMANASKLLLYLNTSPAAPKN